MVRVRVTRDAAGDVVGLSARGHAGFAAHGSDIVCAAVSAILETALMGIEAFSPEGQHHELDDGLLRWQGRPTPATRTIWGTALLGLGSIARDHPRHLEVKEIGGDGA